MLPAPIATPLKISSCDFRSHLMLALMVALFYDRIFAFPYCMSLDMQYDIITQIHKSRHV